MKNVIKNSRFQWQILYWVCSVETHQIRKSLATLDSYYVPNPKGSASKWHPIQRNS